MIPFMCPSGQGETIEGHRWAVVRYLWEEVEGGTSQVHSVWYPRDTWTKLCICQDAQQSYSPKSEQYVCQFQQSIMRWGTPGWNAACDKGLWRCYRCVTHHWRGWAEIKRAVSRGWSSKVKGRARGYCTFPGKVLSTAGVLQKFWNHCGCPLTFQRKVPGRHMARARFITTEVMLSR